MAVASLGTVRRTPDSGVVRATTDTVSTVFVPGGRFVIGSSAPRADGWPMHEAEVRPLQIGRTPVTNAAYAAFLAVDGAPEPPWWKDPDFWAPDQPVVGVTWLEAVAYCVWLGERLGGRWRLPTEAEWEHAACGGDQEGPSTFPVPGPPAVARGGGNLYGLMDLGTLVHEWCCDWFATDGYHSRRYDPRGPDTGEKRVRRGGSWRCGQPRPSWRDGFDPRGRALDGGFRVVREVP